MYATFDDFEIKMTLADAESASHQGDCQYDVIELLRDRRIVRQLEKIGPDRIRAELSKWGAWDDGELANDADNRERVVWLAACQIRDEAREKKKRKG